MHYLMGRYEVSQRRPCRVVRATRSPVYYRSRKDPLTALRQRMRELAQTRVRFGYRRLRVLMQREGWTIGFRAECLNVHWFHSLEDAEEKIEAWRQDYNEHHPHRALRGLSPNEYARKGMLTAANSLP
jgi:transposase InsO family protein